MTVDYPYKVTGDIVVLEIEGGPDTIFSLSQDGEILRAYDGTEFHKQD